MAEKLLSLRRIDSSTPTSFEAPVFLRAEIVDAGAESDEVLVLAPTGRIRRLPRTSFASAGSANTGSLFREASFDSDNQNLTFTKGDSSTVSVNLSSLAGVSAALSASADTGSFILTLPSQAVSFLGGSNISTSGSNASITFNLDSRISIGQATITPTGNDFPLVIKTSNGNTAVSVNPNGILTFTPKATLPTVTTGVVYISGSALLEEGYYLGFDPATTVDEQLSGGG